MEIGGMDWTDTTGDGFGDVGVADTTGDGLIDTVMADSDHDGRVDGIGFDTTGDGLLNEAQSDTDRDGYIDTVGRDLTGDGVLDVGAGPATGGLEVPLPNPGEPAVALGPTLVGGTPAGGNGHIIGPYAHTDPATAAQVNAINRTISETGSVWTEPDRPDDLW